MKKILAILLVLSCLLGCAGAEATVDIDDMVPAVLETVYDEPTVYSYSLLGEMYNATVPGGTLTYIIGGSDFICEYYATDGNAHVWTHEEAGVNDCMQQAFDAAEAFYDYYTAFILVIVGDDGSGLLELVPWLEDSSLSDYLFNDYNAFHDAAMELLGTHYPDAIQTGMTIPGPESYLGVEGVSSVFDRYTLWVYNTETESYEAMRAYAQMLAERYGFTVASLPEEDKKGLLYGETESTFVDIGIAGAGTYIQVAVSSDITLVPSEF